MAGSLDSRSGRRASLFRRQLLRVCQGIDILDRLVAPDGFDSGKTQGESAGVARAWLNGVEGNLQHDVWFHFAIPPSINQRVVFGMLGQLVDLGIGQSAISFADW